MSETGISELTRILPPERVTNDPTELTVYGYDGNLAGTPARRGDIGGKRR